MSFAPNRTDDRDLRLQLFFFKKERSDSGGGKIISVLREGNRRYKIGPKKEKDIAL